MLALSGLGREADPTRPRVDELRSPLQGVRPGQRLRRLRPDLAASLGHLRVLPVCRRPASLRLRLIVGDLLG